MKCSKKNSVYIYVDEEAVCRKIKCFQSALEMAYANYQIATADVAKCLGLNQSQAWRILTVHCDSVPHMLAVAEYMGWNVVSLLEGRIKKSTTEPPDIKWTGENVRRLMKENGYTERAVAEALPMNDDAHASRSTIARMKKRGVLSIRELFVVCQILNVGVSELFANPYQFTTCK